MKRGDKTLTYPGYLILSNQANGTTIQNRVVDFVVLYFPKIK
jgi:hypothetical protein